MPKRNKLLECFFIHFTPTEISEMISRLSKVCVKRNVADSKVFTCVLTDLANEMRKQTGLDRFTPNNVKRFAANNMRLYREFLNFVNTTAGVKYDLTKNRIVVGVEYWQVNPKETGLQRLFRECGFPYYASWSLIVEAHHPGEVLFLEVGSSSQVPIVIKEEPFDPEAVDDWDRHLLMARLQPIHLSKLTTL